MQALVRYLLLPTQRTAFETAYVRKLNRIALVFFALHLPALMVIAAFNGTRPLLAGVLGLAALSGPLLANQTFDNPRSTSVVCGVAAMFFGGLLVHFGQGPMQIEMHFYFFALIAMLTVFGNPMVIIAAATTVALHHLVVWFFVPASVFNYEASVWVVAVHAAFVVLESVATVYVARSFFDNVIGLERIVQARTAELDGRNRDLRLVLDSVEQALATVDDRGVLAAERSAAWARWFGADAKTIFEAFATRSPRFATQLELAWEQLTDRVLPLELLVDQLPKSMTVGKQTFAVTYTTIGAGVERFLVVVTDVTAEVSRAAAEAARRETMHVFERVLTDRAGVTDFFEEAAEIVRAITAEGQGDLVTMKRDIHTLKGVSAIFGLETLVQQCQSLESQIFDSQARPPAVDLDALARRWQELSRGFESVLGSRGRVIEISEEDHALLESEARQVSSSLFRRIRGLRFEPAQNRLTQFAEHARRIAERLDKTVEVTIDGGDIRLPRDWAPFWNAFVHGVRNAIDHGIELPLERLASGKPETGTIALRAAQDGGSLVVEIRDDGRGVDWKRVRAKAALYGLPADEPEDLVIALCHDGLTTREAVTDVSGRGVGMGALRAQTIARGGRLVIESAPALGTTIRMIFPSLDAVHFETRGSHAA